MTIDHQPPQQDYQQLDHETWMNQVINEMIDDGWTLESNQEMIFRFSKEFDNKKKRIRDYFKETRLSIEFCVKEKK